MGMNPFLALIVAKVLDYLADHVDEIIDAVKERFLSVKDDPEVCGALCDLKAEPSEENLLKLSNALEAKGQDSNELASLLVSKTVV